MKNIPQVCEKTSWPPPAFFPCGSWK
jgi:hypothetical protein